MATKPAPQRTPSRYLLILVLFMTLNGILGGCGTSSTAGPSHPTGSTPTSTSTQELKGTISEFSLPTPHLYPGGIMTGPDGNLWFSEADLDGWNNRIGRITPSGTISEFPVPERISSAYGIIAGSDGNLWFIEDPANHSQSDKIERITPAGKISEFPLPNPGTVPGNITVGLDGKIWFTEMNSNKIGRLV
jgi:virginiamycin B lyase